MIRFFNYLFQDTDNNKGNSKGILFLILFRLPQLIEVNRVTRIVFFLYPASYRVFVEWFLYIELPWRITAGKGRTIHHGQALVVNLE